jgi:hypothetical protein
MLLPAIECDAPAILPLNAGGGFQFRSPKPAASSFRPVLRYHRGNNFVSGSQFAGSSTFRKWPPVSSGRVSQALRFAVLISRATPSWQEPSLAHSRTRTQGNLGPPGCAK